MLVVAVLLVILPVLVKPGPSLSAFSMISLGAPIYVCLVMTTPWRLRPSILDQWSGERSHWSEAYVYLGLLSVHIPSLSLYGGHFSLSL